MFHEEVHGQPPGPARDDRHFAAFCKDAARRVLSRVRARKGVDRIVDALRNVAGDDMALVEGPRRGAGVRPLRCHGAKTVGYGGLHLYETPEWWANFYAWGGHAAAIAAPGQREDAGTAIVCLFLETWWWWGDQVKLGDVDKLLEVARKILRDHPDWIAALDEFDQNYTPDFDGRAAAGDKWRRVASALSFISGRLNLRQGEIPDDPVLVRIYICWCFFSGDVAQYTGDLAAADGWLREAVRAGGDRQDDAAMRAARTSQHEGDADAAITRITALFKPYWADAQPPEPPPGNDPLAGIVPPLPDDEVLNTLDSGYAATARLMLNDKLADEIATPVDEPLAAAAAASPAPAAS